MFKEKGLLLIHECRDACRHSGGGVKQLDINF